MTWMGMLKYWHIMAALLPLVQELVKEGWDVVEVVQEGVGRVRRETSSK